MLRESSSTTDAEYDGCGSLPCLKLTSPADQFHFDEKMMSPDSRRKLFSRKPGGARPIENHRSRKLAEETRQLAGFYSPTNHRERHLNDSQTSMFLQSSLMNLTQRTINPRPNDEQNSSSTSIRLCQDRSMHNISQKPRLSGRANNPPPPIPPTPITAAVSAKTDDTAAKKIRILQIQLEAVNLENSRLKQHINLLRSNQQEQKKLAVTEVGSLSGGSSKQALNCREQRLSPDDGSARNKKQNMSDEVQRLRRACNQLNRELATIRQEEQQERLKLTSEIVTLQESEKRLKEQLVQLESILAINRREHSMIKSTNQQLTVRVWNLNRQIIQFQAAEKQRNQIAKSLLKKQRIANSTSRLRGHQHFDEREDQLFELSPDREQ